MKTSKKILVWITAGLVFIAVASFIYRNLDKEKEPIEEVEPISTYTDTDYDIAFDYPTAWSEPTLKPGNKNCPEEDTYRTVDTLSIYDREISFPDVDLENSDSFIRSGVRTYELDPKNRNDCGDELFAGLASGELDGRALSSVQLTPVDFTFAGYYSPRASRLNTEGREQFLLFALAENPEKYLVMQPYMSFIPYFGSPELAEMEEKFDGDMTAYLQTGITAEPIREYQKGLGVIAESIRVSN